jgi:hypothetical protein
VVANKNIAVPPALSVRIFPELKAVSKNALSDLTGALQRRSLIAGTSIFRSAIKFNGTDLSIE